eukprot:TRINITY_DN344_c1_g1_i10.p1 TRINITY_DN344_c1_g1~~TRINITY_DN344_c1_g1_i10.p1  ORF type:complete len:609 (+),score=98.57 TRINITY_DN344_c1_g1_i10:26-1852(+)
MYSAVSTQSTWGLQVVKRQAEHETNMYVRMLRAKPVGRYVVKCLGSGSGSGVPARAAPTSVVKHTFSGTARDPSAAAREPPYWRQHHLTVLQRASHEHGIASNFTTRQQHTARGGKPSPPGSSVSRIHTLGKQRRWQAALRLFENIEEPTALEVRALLATMAYNHQPRHAMTALRQLQGLGAVAFHDYELAIHAQPKELPFKAMELLHEMEREGFGWTQRACSTVLLAFGKAGRLNAALQLIDEMQQRNISPSGADYLILIVACDRGKNGMRAGDRGGSEQALGLLQRMQDKGPMPDIRHYGAAMTVCATGGDLVNAANILQNMRNKGIKPNEQNWAALLDAIGRAGQVTEMMAWYGEMCQTGEQPNVYTMTILLNHAGAAGELGIAEGIWREMRDRQLEPNSYSYSAFINCYATAKQPDEAEEVLAEMVQSATIKPDAITFTSVMKAYIEVERLDDAEQVITRMRAAGVQPTSETWKSIIHAADTLGDTKRTDQLCSDALLTDGIKPYRPWRSADVNNLNDSSNKQPEGTVMDLRGLNSGTARAVIRHELHERQEDARRCKLPLYIITGQGGGLLVAAVSDALKSQGIQHFLLRPGVLAAPSAASDA